MKLFVILFAVSAITIFSVLALKQGEKNRRDILEIEKTEQAQILGEDEEKHKVKKYREIGSFNDIKNTVGKTLKYLGITILFAGTILSLCYAQNETAGFYSLQYGFSFLLFFTCELITCAVGFLFIGLGEIIKLLDDISKTL